MAERRHLPPQIKRVELSRRAGTKPVVRYQLTVDTGTADGKRKQLRRRYRTEREARAALAEIQGQVASGTYVQPSTLTLEQACTDWLRSRHKIRPTTAAGYEYVLQPVQSELGALATQDLTRWHIDDLIVKLRAGELVRPGGKARKAWSARSCNYMLGALSQVLDQLVAEGRLTRNVAALVDRVPGKAKRLQTYTPDQVRMVLRGIAEDRNRHAWHLALAGLRRGEIAGQRWTDIDLENRTLRIGTTRVDVGGRAFDQDEPKTANAGRVLPIPHALLAELAAAKSRQAAEKLVLGEAYADKGFVVCNEAGETVSPVDAEQDVAGNHPRTRRTADPAARRAAYLRHTHASARRAHRPRRGLARPRRRLIHYAYVRSRPTRGVGARRPQLCCASIQLRGLIASHMRAVTPIPSL
jgi:integrase